MSILITGLGGTLAPRLAEVARAAGAEVIGWDRARVPPDDLEAGRRFLDQARPGAIAHLALGGEDWAGFLAAEAEARGVPFLFTSTAMVFHHQPDGPHAPGDERTSQEDYGRYKIRCEDRVRAACPAARVARIGWQIDADGRGNNMLAALDRWQAERGRIDASRLWIPACSFMTDTAAALWSLLLGDRAGTWHLDGNAPDAWTFPELVAALQRRFGRGGWRIAENDDYRHDQRLVGHEALMPRLDLERRRDRLR